MVEKLGWGCTPSFPYISTAVLCVCTGFGFWGLIWVLLKAVNPTLCFWWEDASGFIWSQEQREVLWAVIGVWLFQVFLFQQESFRFLHPGGNINERHFKHILTFLHLLFSGEVAVNFLFACEERTLPSLLLSCIKAKGRDGATWGDPDTRKTGLKSLWNYKVKYKWRFLDFLEVLRGKHPLYRGWIRKALIRKARMKSWRCKWFLF